MPFLKTSGQRALQSLSPGWTACSLSLKAGGWPPCLGGLGLPRRCWEHRTLQPPGAPSPWHRQQAEGRSVGSQGCFRPRPCAPHRSESHTACALTLPPAQGGPWERGEGEASFPLQDQNNPTHQHHGPPAPAPSQVTDSSFWRASRVWKEWPLSLTLHCRPLSGGVESHSLYTKAGGVLAPAYPVLCGELGAWPGRPGSGRGWWGPSGGRGSEGWPGQSKGRLSDL